MRANLFVVMLLSWGILVGCAHKKDQTRGKSPGDVTSANPDHMKFENGEDPPITADTHFAAGQLAESQDQPAKAIEQYKAALKVDPNNLKSMFALGSLYTQMKMFPDAIDIWQQYVKATKQSAAAYNNLAFCFELAHQPKEAENAYQKGIAREPKDQAVRVNYGLMLVRQGRIDEATRQLGAVLKPAEVHYNIGSVLEQQGKKEAARAEYQTTLRLDPNLHDARARLANLK